MKATHMRPSCRWIHLLIVFASTVPMVSQGAPAPLALVPMPREVHWNGDLVLQGAVAIRSASNPEDEFAAHDLADALGTAGIGRGDETGAGSAIVLLRLDTARAKDV